MKHILQIRIIFVFLILFGLSSCKNDSTPETAMDSTNELEISYPAYPAPDAGNIEGQASAHVVEVLSPKENLSTVTGIVLSGRTNNPIVEITVQLAEVIYSGDQGAFVLDTSQSPITSTDRNGRFAFIDIEAQDYVLVIGNVEVNNAYKIVSNENDESAAIWSAPLNNILDTGTHKVLIDGWD